MMRNLRKPSGTFEQDRNRTLAVGAIGLIFIVLFFGFKPLAHRIETAHFPVTKKATVSNPRPAEGGTIVSAKSFKYRDCDWIRTEFRFGLRDGRSVPMPSAKHLGPPQLNKGGDSLYWEEIFLPVGPDLVAQTHWDAYHLCFSSRLWETKTELYQ